MARTILGNGQSITIGEGTNDIFGTAAGAERVTIRDDTIVTFGANFNAGGDTIRLSGDAADFTIRLSGSFAVLTSTSDGIVANIPIGSVGLTVVFQNGSDAYTDDRSLRFDGTNVVLDGQIVTSTATAIAPPAAAFAAFPDESALDVPTYAAFGGSHTSAADVMNAHDGGTVFARTAIESGMTSFIVNFA